MTPITWDHHVIVIHGSSFITYSNTLYNLDWKLPEGKLMCDVFGYSFSI